MKLTKTALRASLLIALALGLCPASAFADSLKGDVVAEESLVDQVDSVEGQAVAADVEDLSSLDLFIHPDLDVHSGGVVWLGDDAAAEPVFYVERQDDGTQLIQNEDFVIVGYEDSEGVASLSMPDVAGDCIAVLEGRGNYCGRTPAYFTIHDPCDVRNCEMWVEKCIHYTGMPAELTILVNRLDVFVRLSEGVDFRVSGYLASDGETFLDEVPVEPGIYYVQIEGIGAYHGTQKRQFSIGEENDIGFFYCQVSGFIPGKADGSPIDEPECDVWYYDSDDFCVRLEQGKDYKVSGYRIASDEDSDWSATPPSEAGYYEILIQGIGEYQGHAEVPFSVVAWNDLSGMTLEGFDPTNDYTGEPVVFKLVASDGSVLVEGVDYQVSYAMEGGSPIEGAPVEVGLYWATFTAIDGSGYVGSFDEWFQIAESQDVEWGCNLSDMMIDGITYVNEYTGNPVSFDVRIFAPDGSMLIEGSDYKVSYFTQEWNHLEGAPSDVGSYFVVFTALEGSGYVGSNTQSFEIADSHNLSAAYVFLEGGFHDPEGPCFLYTGTEVKPNVTVYDSAFHQPLTEGEDYELVYKGDCIGSPDEITSVEVIVRGIGCFKGQYSSIYFIVPKFDLSAIVNKYGMWHFGYEDEMYIFYDSNQQIEFFYTGYPVCPSLRITNSESGYAFEEGKDFDISYIDDQGNKVTPQEMGEYKAVIQATSDGKLSGTAEIPFFIVADKPIDDSFLWFAGRYAYEDEGLILVEGAPEDSKWNLESLFGGSLIEGRDFILKIEDLSSSENEYSDGTGLHKAVATGIGKYRGTVESEPFFYASKKALFELPSLGDVSVNGVFVGESPDDVMVKVDENGLIAPYVNFGSCLMAQGIDFEVVGIVDGDGNLVKNPKPTASAQLLVKGFGEFEGCERKIDVRVVDSGLQDDDFDLSDAVIIVSNGIYYPSDSSSEIEWAILSGSGKPEICVSRNSVPMYLKEGVDYSLECVMNYQSNTFDVKISAVKGSKWKGSKTEKVNVVDSFDIATMTYSAYNPVSEMLYFGYPNNPEVNLFYTPRHNFDKPYASPGLYGVEEKLIEGMDFKVSLLDASGASVEAVNQAGAYTAVVSGMGNWSGVKEIPFTVYEGKGQTQPLSTCTFTSPESTERYGLEFAYDGQPLEPKIQVSYGSRVLEEGKDFTIEFFNNENPSQDAYFVAKAVDGSGFSGTVVKRFDMFDARDLSNYELRLVDPCGNEHIAGSWMPPVSLDSSTPAVKVARVSFDHAKGTSVQKCLDSSCFDLEFGNNEKPGIAWVKVVGKSGYKGELKGNFLLESKEPIIASASTAQVVIGKTARIDCVVSGADGVEVTYSWEYSTDGGKTWDRVADAQGTASLTMTASTMLSNHMFRCVVSAADGREAITEPVKLSMLSVLKATVSIKQVQMGETAKVTCTPSGADGAKLTYSWEASTDGGKTWKKSTAKGQGTASLTMTASTSLSKHQFRCKVTAADGRKVTTGSVKLSMLPAFAASTKLYGYDDVTFSWNKRAGATGYEVYFKKASASKYTLIKRTTALSLKKANLADGVKYNFKVVPYTTVNGVRQYKAAKISSIYTMKKISQPTVTKYSSTKVKVKWTNINGESGYQISKSTSKTGTSIVSTYSTTTGSYKTLNVSKGKNYYYKVRAYKVVDGKKIYGPWSAVRAYKL